MNKRDPKNPWFRRRGYPHFDHPITFHAAKKIVQSPFQVEKHSFYPFVEFTVKTFKIKKIAGTNKVQRKEKKRPIAYAAHVDCHIYSYYSFMLSKKYEDAIMQEGLNECILAFRTLGKSNIDFAARAFDEIRQLGTCFVLALDITGFFDHLDHDYLKNSWATLLASTTLPADHYAVFKSLTKYATVNQENLYKTLGLSLNNRERALSRLCSPMDFRTKVRGSGLIVKNPEKAGIPQGSPISALLSNIYMMKFDSALHDFVNLYGGRYFRYCDDILLIIPPDQQQIAEDFALCEIKKLKLDINPQKTDRINFISDGAGDIVGSKPLQYLGFLFDGKRTVLRSASLAKYSDRMKRGVRISKATMKKRNTARENRGEASKPLFLHKIYNRYTCVGRRNFISYGYSAAKKMESNAIRKQLRKHWNRLRNEIEK